MPSIQERIKQLNASIDYDSMEFYKSTILGQQVYAVMLYAYLFLTVDQDSGFCGKFVRQIPKEKLLRLYLCQVGAEDIWLSQTFGILHKIRRSFAILGLHYQTFGYDSVYSFFKAAVDPFFDEFLVHPVTDNTHFLESYAWKYHHVKITYKVEAVQRFSEKDAIFQATTSFLGKKYAVVGYSKKNAIENLAYKIVNSVIPENQYHIIAASQNYSEIERKTFVFDTAECQETDHTIQQFSEKYGVEPFLMHFALLSRSQMGKEVWERIGIKPPEFLLQTRVSHLKRALISLGQEIILLQLLDLTLRRSDLNNVDFRSLDQTIINIGPDEVHEQLLKILRITDITANLFDNMNAPVKGTLSQKEKNQIANGIVAAFFLSNFAPDKKFAQYFSKYIASVYEEVGLNAEIDYRFSTIAFLSALDIRVKTNHHELGNGIFHAEVLLGDGRNVPRYICENESMRTAKKDVWKAAYNDIIVQLQNFFISPNSNCTNASLLLFVNGVRNNQIISNEFYLRFGILNARNFSNFDRISASKIIGRLKAAISSSIANDFLEVVYRANEGLYIEIDGAIFPYSSWLKSVTLNQEVVPSLTIKDSQIVGIYSSIVNPSIATQKKLIDTDYKLVNRIYPLSDDVAKYAIEKSPDAYNYLQFVSVETEEFFQKLKREEELSDIGTLALNSDSETSIMIMDSHKPVHIQIKELINELKFNRITIACGYCFASGLSLIKDLINYALVSDIPLELHIGALQKYDESNPDNIITGIDKTTIKFLKTFLASDNFSLYTCPDRFYHGKLYIFEGDESSVICMGSSNISRAAFITNYELNIAFKTKTESELCSGFIRWVRQLRYHSKQIKHLDEAMFGDNEIKQDGSVHLTRVSLSSMRNKISELSNSEVQYRLNLWMSYSPDFITENLGIPSLPDYFVFVYKNEHLIVLESFQAGNAYFCIRYENSFEDVINHIATFSKTEIFEYSQMSKRGYHVQNKFTLENNIRLYFKTRRQNEHEK